jgi:1-aminocyclopropane-1-carboxylate deaminase/D-cysteine desulfhydrase-like pyridoxal-dependent ACC family enzyme
MRASALIFKGTTMSNTKATGVAYLDPEFSTMYATEEIGYAPAAQGTVTQATSKSTGVTLNKSAGRITMNGALLAANTAASFTLTNSLISTADSIIVNVSGGGTAAAYTTYISSMTAGSAVITLRNMTAGDLSEAVIINFAIIHGAS